MTKLIRIHSQGKQATLYEGATQLGKRVAVKQLSNQVRENPRLRDRFFKAAQDWANVPHRHLLDYIDVDLDKGWIITDWLPRSAADLRSCSPNEGLRMMHQSLQALHHLNNKGFFHGNIKPSNLLLDDQDNICLCDGLMLSIDNPGVIPSLGTAKYLAPEMTGATSAVPGPGIDLYALGFTILELMAGDSFISLFPGISREASDHDTAWIAWHANLEATLPPAAEIVADCPPEFGAVIDKMLLKDPFQRFRFAKQALEYLPDVLEPVRTAARGPSVGASRSAPVDNRTRHDHDAAATTKFSAKHVMTRPASGVVVVVASGSDAGKTHGIDSPNFSVGFDSECDVVLQDDVDLDDPDAMFQIRRGAGGWSIQNRNGGGFILNQKHVGSSCGLRSGDIVRMSWKGPDFQFYLQSGSPSVNELAAKYLSTPKQNPVAPRDRGTPAARRPEPSSRAPHAPAAAAPRAPAPRAPHLEPPHLEPPHLEPPHLKPPHLKPLDLKRQFPARLRQNRIWAATRGRLASSRSLTPRAVCERRHNSTRPHPLRRRNHCVRRRWLPVPRTRRLHTRQMLPWRR